MNKGFCVWFTGLNASGKSTLAHLLADSLTARGLKAEIIDSEEIRKILSNRLGLTPSDRETNLRYLASLVKVLVQLGVVVLVAAVSPYRRIRREVRAEIGDFVEIFLNCPLETCRQRDAKGFYRQALTGEGKQVAGLDDPYEAPEQPEIELGTGSETPLESLARIIHALEAMGCIPPVPGRAAAGGHNEG